MRKNDTELNKKCGKRLSECRNAANMTQEALGRRVGLSKQQIWNIEKGERALTPSNALLIGKELAVDPDYLLCRTEISSFKQFFTENIREEAEKPLKSQIIYELIKSRPDCTFISWCLSAQGEKSEWGWHIRAVLRTGATGADTGDYGKEYKFIYLDNAAQIRIFDVLTDLMGYQLYKQKNDPEAFGYYKDANGVIVTTDEFPLELWFDQLHGKKIIAEEPVIYDEFKKEEAAGRKNGREEA